eukprot:CAMPEP_0114603412 /NCGR_PEP_ID=MMETSP0168-20121206/9_1 /TAXON_ID=95228 ORGANISM="Vannella sp., Strain DIVA3 517/6/12" /NCGR_SAMPLE_ID=MMETSP0168 /ASSEMBLY_ACC=CAM_ASM_000044 /LENGTH=219 /DNA_ID=CAMNT_0001814197 /DNA_START=28 /DNA_END=687 /DNA_ORIENTATION=-
MKVAHVLIALVALGLASCVSAHADSWLVYAEMQNTNIVTYMNATVIVPPAPTTTGGDPAFWPGIEDSKQQSVIQPILKWINRRWYIFNEYVTPEGRDYQTFHEPVSPGDTIFMEITYYSHNTSYVMHIASQETGYENYLSYTPQAGYQYTDAYFSFEHQPNTCAQYPPSNNITFFDTNLSVGGIPVTPSWTTGEVNPACDSTVNVVSPTVVQFLWDSEA